MRLGWMKRNGWRKRGQASLPPFVLTEGGSAAAPAISVAGDPDTGIAFLAANTLALIAGGSRSVQAGAFAASFPDVAMSISLGLSMPSDTTPTALALGVNNDVNLGNLANFTRYRITPNAGGSSISSIAGGSDGTCIILQNIHASVAVTLTHAAATGTAGNRIFCPGSADVTVPANGTRVLWYDATDSRWRTF